MSIWIAFLPNADVKIKICHHITCITVLPTAASKTEKWTENLQVITHYIRYLDLKKYNKKQGSGKFVNVNKGIQKVLEFYACVTTNN